MTKEKNSKKTKKPILIDVFAGAGGMSLGFEEVGFRSVAGIENDPTCVDCLKTNFPNMHIISEDVSRISGRDVLADLGLAQGEVDVVGGGPPCQGFSLIGLRDRNDPRSGLIFRFHELVAAIQPKVFVMENVPGIMSTHKGKFLKDFVKLMEGDGYRIVHPIRILNAATYGVPQARRRVFVIGVREDLDIDLSYPEPTHVPPRYLANQLTLPHGLINGNKRTPTVRDAISDLPEVDRYDHLIESDETPYTSKPKSQYARMMRGLEKDKGSLLPIPKGFNREICTGCRRTVHGPVLIKRFSETQPGKVVPISRLYKLDWDSVSNTLRAGTPRERGAYSSPRPVHPKQLRVVTVREGARLQSFPDWHRFHVTKWHGFRQVGNAVPPLLARAVANSVKAGLLELR